MENVVFKTPKGLNEEIIKEISEIKDEPAWMLEARIKAFEHFKNFPNPTCGKLKNLNLDEIHYYLKPILEQKTTWEEVPQEIRETFEKLGIPKAEREYLAGVKTQFESEVIYGSLREELKDQGVIFTSIENALKNHSDIFKKYFGTVVPADDNKYAALNSAVWSGGSFVYIPKRVKVERPLQTYFRINAKQMGQFERTLIIADEESEMHYVEGCTAPLYSQNSLHAAVVEILVMRNAKVKYTTVQNWSKNVFNLVTKRAHVAEGGRMQWVDGNLGAGLTMKYPGCYLKGEGAHGEMLSIAYASEGQEQDVGAKMIHEASNTSSQIVSKAINNAGGKTIYRGLIDIKDAVENVKTKVECDTLVLGDNFSSSSYPKVRIKGKGVQAEHETSVNKIEKEKLHYLMSRGIDEKQAKNMILTGFIEPIVNQLPLEYAVELNALIELETKETLG